MEDTMDSTEEISNCTEEDSIEEDSIDEQLDYFSDSEFIDLPKKSKEEEPQVEISKELAEFQEMRINQIVRKKEMVVNYTAICIDYNMFSIILCSLYERCNRCKKHNKYCYHIGAHDYSEIINVSKTCKKWYEFGKAFFSQKDIILVDLYNRDFPGRIHYGFKDRTVSLRLTKNSVEKTDFLVYCKVTIEPHIRSVCLCRSREWCVLLSKSKNINTKPKTKKQIKNQKLHGEDEDPEVLLLTRGIRIKVDVHIFGRDLTLKDIKDSFERLYSLPVSLSRYVKIGNVWLGKNIELGRVRKILHY